MGFRYLFAGFVFLFNPNLNIFDLLPDFVGYALIIYGLRRMLDLAPAIADSVKVFLRLFLLSLAKTIIFFMTAGLRDKGYLLVFTFIFTIAELPLMLSAFSLLYDGLFFAGTMFDGTEPVKRLAGAQRMTTAFIIIRGTLTLLPELVYLSVTEDVGYMLAAYKGGLYVISVTVMTVSGIIWLVRMRSFCRAAGSDTHFINNMTTYYNEYIKPNTNLFTLRRIRWSLGFIGAGLFFLPDMYIDGIDVTPDTVGMLLIITGLALAAKYIPVYKPLVITTVVGIVTSAGGWIYVRNFARRYFTYGIGKNMEAFRMFRTSIAVSVIEAAVIVALIVLLTRYLRMLIADHTGIESAAGLSTNIEKEEDRRRSLRYRAIAFAVLGIICALSGVAYTISLYTAPAYWMINLLIGIAWLITAYNLLYSILNNAERKYL
ncbi:MAG: hypothetical protein PHZ09_06005 [Eubacteriales bacterium]|nr:hypothetical protein [Eubacteriales bacterium]